MKPIPYGKQDITQADIEAVVSILKSDFLTQGPSIQKFEEAFAHYVGAKYAVAVANGTAALHLCMMAMDVDSQSRVITTPITFAASANCVRYCGGEVDFVDIDPDTLLIDLEALERKLRVSKKKYDGIIPVDFAGRPVNLEALKNIANEYGLWIVEDACHAPGGFFTTRDGKKSFCGNSAFAELAIFSFHPVKHIACGEGGMITTNDQRLYEKLLLLRTHGITKDPILLGQNHGGWYYEMQTLGFNYRLTDFQAALGISQLSRADDGLEKRRAKAARYDQELKSLPIRLYTPPSDGGHAFHLYVIHCDRRLELYNFLRSRNIFTQVHYIPVYTFPYYQRQGFEPGAFPIAEKYYEGCLSLPMYPSLSAEEQTFVIKSLHDFFT